MTSRNQTLAPGAIPDPDTTPTLDVTTTAQLLGVSRELAYRGVRAGDIPSIRVGGRIRVPTAALLRMLERDE